jgi:DNA-binding response OmpR family regulator
VQRSAESAPHRPLSVLVIDDEDYVADMIATVLRREQYQVYVAYNGREGLALIQGQSLDLIIVDIMLPYFSGIRLIEMLQTSHDRIQLPVILISAGARPQRDWPRVWFLPKPFTIEELVGLVVATIGAPQSAQD